MSKKKLGLDLDHTLIISDILEMGNHSFSHHFLGESAPRFFWKRSHIEEFLAFALDNFDVVILTAASKEYAEIVVEKIGLAGKVTVKCRDHWKKSLVKNSYGQMEEDYVKVVNNMVVVDDKDYIIKGENNTIIKVKPCWTYADDELLKVIEKLKTLI